MIETSSPTASTLKLATLTLDDLAGMTREELDDLYALTRTPRIADLHGPFNGLALGNAVVDEKIKQLWKGKIFQPLGPERGVGTNRIVAKTGELTAEYELIFSLQPALQGGGEVVALNYDLPVNPPQVRAILDELKQLNDHLFLGIANQKTADGYKFLLYFALQYVCPASARLKTGPGDDGYYRTLAPFEHFDSLRTIKFPHTCPVETLANAKVVSVSTRQSVSDYPYLYNLVTRERDELFVYGGQVSGGSGAYVAKIDAYSLRESWRIYIQAPTLHHWNYPGVLAAHANGKLYAIAGNLLARIDPDTLAHRIVALPEHPGQGGAAYNGFVISPDGMIFAKSMERGKGCDGEELAGLECVERSGIPSFLVAVDPDSLERLAVVETPEPIIGRIASERRDGRDYVYLPGVTTMWRYLFTGTSFELDQDWQVRYVPPGAQPGTGVGMLGDWVIVQTNFLRSPVPLTVWAIDRRDSSRTFTFQPFPDTKISQELSKASLDLENHQVYVEDQLACRTAALGFDPDKGFSLQWETQQTTASFSILIADRKHRQIVGTWYTLQGDRVVFRDAASGRVVALSDEVDTRPNGSAISPGFGGRFYYMAQTSQKVVELSLVPAED
ncbi:MAG: hypothetical protein DMF53_13975 [Acidobacteria bacterium]|nr:MAG: hypothetical protein DMF53_13975 [Acidobacteriota bacterium]